MAAILAAATAATAGLSTLHVSGRSSLSRTRCHLRAITSSLSSPSEFNITFAPSKPKPPKPLDSDDLGKQLFIPWIVRDQSGKLTLQTTPPARLLHALADAKTQKKKKKESKVVVATATVEPKHSKAARRFYNQNFRDPPQRLSKVLASAGGIRRGARRFCNENVRDPPQRLSMVPASAEVILPYTWRSSEELIFEGRVTVNGSVCNTPQTRVDPARDVIYVNGNRLPKKLPPKVYLALNKPKGYICSSGEKETKSVMSLFDDYLKSWIHCRYIDGVVNKRHLIAISEGTVIDGVHCTPDAVELLPQQPDISRPRLRIVDSSPLIPR
ncbi:pseudouridine synthase family protein [Actinidia rufa]|uniref:Pseudouridine synthase family protein n=1 Tax=Actinidia rufa TaxID=165716 RepID=A0A7J0G515_9ERIC|nr:pseudouridine synthase family protein [Actinidia rufa]